MERENPYEIIKNINRRLSKKEIDENHEKAKLDFREIFFVSAPVIRNLASIEPLDFFQAERYRLHLSILEDILKVAHDRVLLIPDENFDRMLEHHRHQKDLSRIKEETLRKRALQQDSAKNTLNLPQKGSIFPFEQ